MRKPLDVAEITTYQHGGQVSVSPAEWVIRCFGGVRATARALGRSPGTVVKWRQPKEQRGTGGEVPRGVQRIILELARTKKLDITPNDLMFGRKVVRRIAKAVILLALIELFGGDDLAPDVLNTILLSWI